MRNAEYMCITTQRAHVSYALETEIKSNAKNKF